MERRKPRRKYSYHLGVRLTRDIEEALAAEANARGLDMSEVVRDLLKKELIESRSQTHRLAELAQ